MRLKHKAAIAIILALAIVVSVSFASGLLNQAFSNPQSAKNSELTNLADEPSNNSNNNTDTTPVITTTPTPKPTYIPTDFIVNGTGGNTVTANINLNDGMNRDEAVLVAEILFPQVHSHATYELKSAEVNEANIWTVSLPWGAVSPDGSQENHNHYFIAEIDPLTKTIQFNTCF
jgi:hypothetical protein